MAAIFSRRSAPFRGSRLDLLALLKGGKLRRVSDVAGVDEVIVREYFEGNGFLVRQLRKYQVQARAKRSDEEIDLLVYNPAYRETTARPSLMLYSNELPLIHRAIVFIKAWHSQRFTPGTLRGSADLAKFLEKDVLKQASELFQVEDSAVEKLGVEHFYKLLVIPSLPTHEPHKSQSLEMLREAGVDAVVSFRAILQDLVAKVEVNYHYQKSDVLQILRLLKNYDMIKSPQMELFQSGKKGGS